MNKLKFRDNAGNIGEGQTLTDLAQNTITINKLRTDIKLLWLATMLLIFLFLVYIARYDIWTNSLKILAGG